LRLPIPPRPVGWESNRSERGRQCGGGSISTGAVNLCTVTATPATGVLTTVSVSATGTYRCFQYLAPAGSFGNIAEAKFLS
jgi:hypothetical protein